MLSVGHDVVIGRTFILAVFATLVLSALLTDEFVGAKARALLAVLVALATDGLAGHQLQCALLLRTYPLVVMS